jgi:transposase
VSRRVLSDELWERIEPLLPAVKGPMGRPFRVHRQVIEGIVYRYRAGIAWRVLPGEFGLW